MKAKLTLFAISLLIGGYIAAQSSVQIIDILVSPTMVVDTITNLPVDNSGENLAVMCKVNDLSSVETVRILFGTIEESGDVLSIDAVVSENAGTYSLSINGELTELSNNVITAYIELSQEQSEAYNFITMFVVDVSEQGSNHLLFTK